MKNPVRKEVEKVLPKPERVLVRDMPPRAFRRQHDEVVGYLHKGDYLTINGIFDSEGNPVRLTVKVTKKGGEAAWQQLLATAIEEGLYTDVTYTW